MTDIVTRNLKYPTIFFLLSETSNPELPEFSPDMFNPELLKFSPDMSNLELPVIFDLQVHDFDKLIAIYIMKNIAAARLHIIENIRKLVSENLLVPTSH